MRIAGAELPVHSVNTLIIGSGAAALNAALQLRQRGVADIMIVTERWGAGTSFEAGSDKQTYYKLSLAHDMTDSPRRMAADLFRGGCMHGDIALCEAQHSAQAFYHLVQRGVPFPHDEFGAYVGYRTDHDPAGRATSAGPLTSRMMGECLGKAVRDQGIPVLDRHQVITLLTKVGKNRGHELQGGSVCGAVAIDLAARDADDACGFAVFNATNVILATGGPGGIYRTSVYPQSQVGSTGLALAIGAKAQNLTESQFGLASIGFRWNLSGSYQQVIPRYVSTDADGSDEREFLNDFFPDLLTLTLAIFRKGYQWPFDSAKVANYGSSLIDVLVQREIIQLGRRVFLDFTGNPAGRREWPEFSLDALGDEVRSYLAKSSALHDTPIERLRAMNEPAYELYRRHDIDLARDRLEIAVCAQHCNGGLAGNLWWESNVRGLFPVGEVNGSHGVRRPGGSALNAGQVGGIRAATFIAHRRHQPPPVPSEFAGIINDQLTTLMSDARRMMAPRSGKTLAPAAIVNDLRERMTAHASITRRRSEIEQAAADAWALLGHARRSLTVASSTELPQAFRALDLCLTHVMYLEAINEYLRSGGGSRGSMLVLDSSGETFHADVGPDWRHRPADPDCDASSRILQIALADQNRIEAEWIDPRPLPDREPWFEEVWRAYRENRVVG